MRVNKTKSGVEIAHDGGVVSLHFLLNEPILVSSGTDNALKVRSFMHSLFVFSVKSEGEGEDEVKVTNERGKQDVDI